MTAVDSYKGWLFSTPKAGTQEVRSSEYNNTRQRSKLKRLRSTYVDNLIILIIGPKLEIYDQLDSISEIQNSE